jgi:hypothetical protein
MQSHIGFVVVAGGVIHLAPTFRRVPSTTVLADDDPFPGLRPGDYKL